jgi:hypothetical protein
VPIVCRGVMSSLRLFLFGQLRKVHSKNIWTVKIKIAVVRLVKSLVIFILPSCHL